jgi:hypothetical protein
MKTPPAYNDVQQTGSNWKQVTLGELLLWTAATAVVLGHEQWRVSTAGRDDVFRSYFNGRLLFFAPLDGACLAGLVLCVAHWFHGRRPFSDVRAVNSGGGLCQLGEL